VDLFTHVLVAYLLTFGIVGFQPSYLAAGALAGGLPDADAFFFPLAKRFPILRHHGITHSITGVTVVAVAGAWIAPMIAPGSPWVYFLVMEVGGLSHMLEDGFTHFSVPPLLPFSDRRLEVDADRAINFLTLIVSVVGFYLLLGVERNHVAFAVYLDTLYGLTAFFVAYFSIRIAARLRIGQLIKRLGTYRTPVPTGNPFVWLVLSEEKTGGEMRTTFARYVFGRGITKGPFSVAAPLESSPGTSAPVTTAQEALARSYPLARRASTIFDQTYHFGDAKDLGADGWVANWYSLEFEAFGRAAGVRVKFPKDGGAPVVKSAWHTPLWRQELT
jgi:membrane-bound metal-dependent hydrolase YbcI (DUF457 family)